jgi:hypothetical protein
MLYLKSVGDQNKHLKYHEVYYKKKKKTKAIIIIIALAGSSRETKS